MCGISAIFRFNLISDTDIKILEAMNTEMVYRGPDDNDTWSDTHCGLAQTRLSIIDVEKGHQPLFNEDKSLVLICNGEIYNYLELQDELKKKGHVLSTGSDSETILHLYEDYGTECLQKLRGQFAFCLWDIKKQQLFAARDRIGEKTLYYAHIPGGGIVFCSELKTILKYHIPHPQINLEQLAHPIRYTSPLSYSKTFIEQINKLEPAQYILVNQKGLLKYQYWQRNKLPQYTGSVKNAKNYVLQLMREAVDINLRSDVPIAIMLSGGIDSSAIAALAKETGRDVHTITAGYAGDHYCDERDAARKFAKDHSLIYHEVELDESDYNSCFHEFTQFIDEPITDSAAIAQWALYKKVKKLGFKVLLGGMGGDELFYGYPYWNQMADSLAVFRKHQSLLPWTGNKKKKEYIKFFLKNWKYILKAGYPRKIADSSMCSWMYDDYVKFSNSAIFSYDGIEFDFKGLNLGFNFKQAKPGSEIDLIYDFAFKNIMTMTYLYLSDRLGMGNSIEIRSPLLDYKLVEGITSLPISYKYKKNQPKFFLKQVLHNIVPDYILHAPKRGFTPPDKFIKDVVNNYNYNFFSASHKFYNSILADRLLSLLIENE
jgi:asparagine synthase (glutamine-hydrolysing)